MAELLKPKILKELNHQAVKDVGKDSKVVSVYPLEYYMYVQAQRKKDPDFQEDRCFICTFPVYEINSLEDAIKLNKTVMKLNNYFTYKFVTCKSGCFIHFECAPNIKHKGHIFCKMCNSCVQDEIGPRRPKSYLRWSLIDTPCNGHSDSYTYKIDIYFERL